MAIPKIFNFFNLLAVAVIGGLLCCVAHAADQDFFAVYGLEVEGKIHNFVTGDFDGNGLTDMAVIFTPTAEPKNRYLGIYLQKSDRGFPSKIEYSIALPPTAAQVDAGDVDGDGKAEILFIDADGISSVKLTGGALAPPVRIITQETAFTSPLFEGILVEPFIFEMGGRPGPEIIFPVNGGYAIYSRGAAGSYQMQGRLDVPLASCNSDRVIESFSGHKTAVFSVELATVKAIDGNLDGRTDLYFLWKDRICGHFQDASGNFSVKPDFEVSLAPAGVSGYLESCLGDFNGDGRPDAAVMITTGGVSSTESKLRFYPADSRGMIGPQFKKEISLSDSHCNLLLGDYNSDKKMEVVVPTMEVGAIAITKMLLLKKADLHLLVYSVTDGAPAEEPTFRNSFPIRFNFDEALPTREVAMDWTADYNGDGLLDFVFSDGSGRLQFFWGQARDFLSKKPGLEIPIDHSCEIHSVHLNKGKFSDLVIEHNLTGKIDRITVLKNKSNKL